MKITVWKQEEDDFLIRFYSTSNIKELSQVLDRTDKAIRARAKRLNLKKEFTGVAIVDGKKQCTICKKILDLSEFHTSRISKNGYACACKFCNSPQQKQSRKIERIKIDSEKKLFVCHNCGIEKYGWEFKWSTRKKRREHICQSCSTKKNQINKINRIKQGRDW